MNITGMLQECCNNWTFAWSQIIPWCKDYHEYHDWSAASCSSSRGNYTSEANMKPRYGCEPNYTSHGSVETSKTSFFQPDRPSYAVPLADDMNGMNKVPYFHL
ncbi:hypothetical protein PV325_011857 [Microctonus aethiopoides]|nr:hypothetical protein PV325_011857 [Microctonus aethiopoides]